YMNINLFFVTTFAVTGVISFNALADPICTTESPTKWMPIDAAKEVVKSQGYKVKKLKKTSSGCYELYGYDKDGKRAEIYYNPVDMSVVEENDED
ncbi:TPA: PepSY domain-containing protein, partial [Vibrio parahaemolyticus]|uniref:PepSY domain-containing protein n=6 Tax=Vibrio parahaemolyticus TaxID=670 RepID=UPI0027E59E3B